MSFLLRAAIALLAGIGAGLIGFWIVWSAVWKVVGEHPGIGHDSWLLAGIFVPGVVSSVLVFRGVSRAVAIKPV
ncbi:unnamed protein product [Gemmata massiliana]|uniref:Uncharacterized protein n=1 Tax=Gemmata massiliana TaxID=1210884 RepID=A0A6P2D857_9BACT|nr:unnamed protein product [Gemmata massiliana]